MSEKKIFLFVDDSRVSRMKIRQIAAQARPNLELVEATSGEEAIEKTRTVKADLISVDINMPGMDGLQAVVHLKENCPNAKIVLLSGNVQDEMQRQAVELGVGFVEKPVTDVAINKVLSFLS